jgi:hypothetical protein
VRPITAKKISREAFLLAPAKYIRGFISFHADSVHPEDAYDTYMRYGETSS